MVMTPDELLIDWLHSELNDEIERIVRRDGPIRYDERGMAVVRQVALDVIGKMSDADLQRLVNDSYECILRKLG
jgi:hypothetical protein